MTNQETFARLLAQCNPEQLALIKAAVDLGMGLQDVAAPKRAAILEAVGKLASGEGPADLDVWAAAIGSWE